MGNEMGDEVIPTCDICGRSQWDSPNVIDYGPSTEDDWNGETGNHKYCEANSAIWPDSSSPLYGMTESKRRPIITEKTE